MCHSLARWLCLRWPIQFTLSVIFGTLSIKWRHTPSVKTKVWRIFRGAIKMWSSTGKSLRNLSKKIITLRFSWTNRMETTTLDRGESSWLNLMLSSRILLKIWTTTWPHIPTPTRNQGRSTKTGKRSSITFWKWSKRISSQGRLVIELWLPWLMALMELDFIIMKIWSMTQRAISWLAETPMWETWEDNNKIRTLIQIWGLKRRALNKNLGKIPITMKSI